ncbi:hypothetical protein [Flavobacterium sp.]|uniref:recombination directionality factor n=1 Tax=Flavobacterium sp. TaxID=239 RepID=UPI00262E0B3B|nr:hypothetical protein [Flavobacterium sp.]
MIQHHVSSAIPATSLLSEIAIRPQISGRIRLGVKVLTYAASANPDATRIYDEGLQAGMSYDAIAFSIEKNTGLTNPLRPDNTEMLNISAKDFDDPLHYQFLLDKYGEEVNGEKVLRSIEVVLPFNSIESAMPHRFACYASKAIKYFSEYEAGVRNCCVGQANQTVRPVRLFGRKKAVHRNDDHIHEVCSPEHCPEFQNRDCTLDLKLLFTVPGLKSSGLLQVQTRSMMALYQWAGTLKLVSIASDLRKVTFTLRKKQYEISFYDKKGVLQKSRQWIPILTAPVELSTLIQSELDSPTALPGVVEVREVSDSFQLTDSKPECSIEHSPEEIAQMNDDIARIKNSNLSETDKLVKKIKILLKFHKISGNRFHDSMIAKHGENWSIDINKLNMAYSLLSMHLSNELAKMF